MLGKLFGKKKKVGEERARMETKSFFDCIAPATIRFYANYFLVGDTYRCVWVIREYPPSTEEQAILSHLADHSGITLRMFNRLVEAYEQRQPAIRRSPPAAVRSSSMRLSAWRFAAWSI